MYDDTAGMPEPSPRKIVEELMGMLDQEIMHAQKAVVSLNDRLASVISAPHPETTIPKDVKFPCGDSALATTLRDYCLRIETLGDSLNQLRNRIEL